MNSTTIFKCNSHIWDLKAQQLALVDNILVNKAIFSTRINQSHHRMNIYTAKRVKGSSNRRLVGFQTVRGGCLSLWSTTGRLKKHKIDVGTKTQLQ